MLKLSVFPDQRWKRISWTCKIIAPSCSRHTFVHRACSELSTLFFTALVDVMCNNVTPRRLLFLPHPSLEGGSKWALTQRLSCRPTNTVSFSQRKGMSQQAYVAWLLGGNAAAEAKVREEASGAEAGGGMSSGAGYSGAPENPPHGRCSNLFLFIIEDTAVCSELRVFHVPFIQIAAGREAPSIWTGFRVQCSASVNIQRIQLFCPLVFDVALEQGLRTFLCTMHICIYLCMPHSRGE